MRPIAPFRLPRAVLGPGVLAAVAAAPAAAQPPAAPMAPIVDSGAVVRVRAPGAGLRGQRLTVAALRGDTLLLRGRRPTDAWRVPLADVERLEVRTGRGTRGASARRGALVGLAAGVVPTLALYPAARDADRDCSGCFISAQAVLVVFGTGLTALTTTAGAIIGHNRPAERWAVVKPPRARLEIAPTGGGGAAVGVRLRF